MRIQGVFTITGIACLVALVAVAAGCTSDPGTVALTGTVSSQEEGQMEGVVVSARRETANFTVSVVSDAAGHYSFPRTHLVPGRYNLTTRAVGYDLVEAGSVEVPADGPGSRDLQLQETEDLASQLTSVEWVMSMPGTTEQKDRLVYRALSCAYCHTFKRIMHSKLSAEQLDKAMHRMQEYYPDGTAVSDDNRGRAQQELTYGGSLGNPTKPRVESNEEGPSYWGKEISEYLASVNLSGGRTTWDFEFKTLPRPTGKSTRVIITEWDMPRRDTVSHDSIVDSKGQLWYGDESRQFVSKLDPQTNTITEYPLPSVPADSLAGARDILVDKDDNVWFPLRIGGGASPVHKFEPETQKLTKVDGAFGQFIAIGGDGKIWTGTTTFHRVDPTTMKKDASFNWSESPNAPKMIACYQLSADSKGNPWCTGYFGSYIINVDAQSGEARFWSTPTPSAMPRRNKMDAQDRYWFAQYTADKVGMFDTRTEKFQEWSLPHKYTTPYATSEPDKYGRVYVSSNMTERLARVDTNTGEVVEYLMPGNFDSKKIWVDPSADRPAVMMVNTRAARILRVEPLD